MSKLAITLLVLLALLIAIGIGANIMFRSEVGALRSEVQRLSGTLDRLDDALQRIMKEIPMGGPGTQEFTWWYSKDGVATKHTFTVTRQVGESDADFKARGQRELAAEQLLFPPI